MNYSNMIEEKTLKKGFIIATLISTVVGTFTASMALHDKIKERMEKNKQKGIDNNQDTQLKELQEKLEKLEKQEGGGDDKEKGEKGDGNKTDSKSQASRSGSRSGRGQSRRDSPMQEDDFAQAAQRSRSLIEQTYNENVNQLGPKYAQGDLITENALQAQVIQLQQTVIEVLQSAVSTGRALSNADLRRIAHAQDIARDGSVEALNAQRDRLMAERPPSTGKVLEEEPGPPPPPPPQSRSAPPIEKPRQTPLPLESVREKAREGRSEPDKISRAKTVYEVELPARKALPPAEPPRAMPWGRQPEMDRSSRKSVYQEPVLSSRGNENRSEPPRKTSSREEPPPRQRENYPDPFASAALGVAAGTVAGTVAGTKSGRSSGHRDDPPQKATSKAPSQKSALDAQIDRRSSVREPLVQEPIVQEPWLPPADAARRRSVAVQEQASIRRAWEEPHAPPKANSDPVRKAASERGRQLPPSLIAIQSPIKPSSVTSPPPPSASRRSARGSPPPGPKSIKALPAPNPPLFCRYSKELQKNNTTPLDKAFSRSGDHRCPSCRVDIPVETRDVWVLSTHFPANSKKDPAKQMARDYRMDARFVVKCHTADGRGHFACVLCDKFKDMDCICRDVDALVKHLGTAHSPEEFEGDPDLVRMKDGSVVNGKSGRELMLA